MGLTQAHELICRRYGYLALAEDRSVFRDTFIADAARKSFAEHEAILAACIAHDADAARARMCDHIRRATDAILAKIE